MAAFNETKGAINLIRPKRGLKLIHNLFYICHVLWKWTVIQFFISRAQAEDLISGRVLEGLSSLGSALRFHTVIFG